MPIPTYDQMLHPLLTMAASGDLTRRNAERVERTVEVLDLVQNYFEDSE